MTKRIILRPRASLELDDHFARIAETNFEAALRFFDAAHLTLAQMTYLV
jgi:toxin ParE1/3/4